MDYTLDKTNRHEWLGTSKENTQLHNRCLKDSIDSLEFLLKNRENKTLFNHFILVTCRNAASLLDYRTGFEYEEFWDNQVKPNNDWILAAEWLKDMLESQLR